MCSIGAPRGHRTRPLSTKSANSVVDSDVPLQTMEKVAIALCPTQTALRTSALKASRALALSLQRTYGGAGQQRGIALSVRDLERKNAAGVAERGTLPNVSYLSDRLSNQFGLCTKSTLQSIMSVIASVASHERVVIFCVPYERLPKKRLALAIPFQSM